jgi:hypothetical protein
MVEYNLDRARQAVQYLVDSSYFRHHVTKLRNTLAKPRALPFRGDSETLNELLVIGRQSPGAMENLIAVAEFKRGGKNDYQRQYMAAKRKRDRKVLLLEQLMSGKTLDNPTKARVLKHQYAVWNKERDAMLQTVDGMPWAQKNERIRQFWERKESEIDALIAEARASGPVKRKYRVDVPRKPKTAFGEKLAAVVDRRR